jgi:hypothetical protein
MEVVLRMSGGSEKCLKTISNIFAGQMESDFNAPSSGVRIGLKFRLIKRANNPMMNRRISVWQLP